MKKFIDLKTLSKLNSISVSRIRQLTKQGLPHYRVKRKILVDPDEFYLWFDQKFKVKNSIPHDDRIDKIVEETLAEFGIRDSAR